MKLRHLSALINQPRMILIFATWLYAYSIHHAYVTYLHPVWEYFGFTHKSPDLYAITLTILLLTIGGIFLPLTINRASVSIVLPLFIVVYIPAIIISTSLDVDSLSNYAPSLFALGAIFPIICIVSRLKIDNIPRTTNLPGANFSNAILGLWIVCCMVLIYKYGSIMKFAGLEDVYEQRSAGASTHILLGYAQTYLSNILSPALIALGLITSRIRLVIIGTIGCLVIYMITAQRTVFLLPMVMIGFNLLMKRKTYFFRSNAFILIALSTIVVLSVEFYVESIVASLLAVFLVFRTLGLPGLTFSQYYDLFNNSGFTWWSHVKGFNLLIAAPPAFATHPAWPGLGYIVGDKFYGNIENNANANLFSGDGLAAAGALGVIVIGAILAIFLFLLDRGTRGWDKRYIVLVMLPVGISLTNGHFFTTLTSFGGIFWFLVFYFYKPESAKIKNSGNIKLAISKSNNL